MVGASSRQPGGEGGGGGGENRWAVSLEISIAHLLSTRIKNSMRGVETSSLSSLGHSLLKKQRWRWIAIFRCLRLQTLTSDSGETGAEEAQHKEAGEGYGRNSSNGHQVSTDRVMVEIWIFVTSDFCQVQSSWRSATGCNWSWAAASKASDIWCSATGWAQYRPLCS